MGLLRGMFGRGVGSSGAGSASGYMPQSLSFGDKLGLIGDVLTGDHDTADRLSRQQELQFRQQQADQEGQLAMYKLQHPEPTAIQRNHDYFTQIGRPDLAESYLNAQANPQTLMTDPTTGQLGFYPKGGVPEMNITTPPGMSGGMGQPGDTAQGAPKQPTPAAISRLRANPSEAALYDQTFGPGSAARVLGRAR